MSYKRDGTDEREFTKLTLPSPSVTKGAGHRKQSTLSVESVIQKSNRDVDENGLMH